MAAGDPRGSTAVCAALAALTPADRCVVMGVLNVTPDSFSDGGRHADPVAAIAHGRRLRAAGADIVDVGGESTRPGATRVGPDEEARRVLPVITALAAEGVPVSVDTMRAELAGAAVEGGAVMVNDVSGGQADPRMLPTLAELGVPIVLGHWRPGSPTGPGILTRVVAELAGQVTAAAAAGISDTRIVLDPGLGFAKDAEDNWAILGGLAALTALGRPLLIGASRKSFLGALLASTAGPRPVAEREDATTAVSALAAAAGAWGVRVHAVAASRDAVAVAARWRPRPGWPG